MSALRIELLGPAGDNSLHKLVRRPAYPCGHFVAGDAAKRRDLFPHRAGHAWHGEIDARPKSFRRQARGVDEKVDRGARARMCMPYTFGDRQERLLAGERFPDNA